MQSKGARYILSRSRRDWSKREGYRELGWLTVQQLAVEASLKIFFKVLWNKKPLKIFTGITTEDDDGKRSPRKIAKEDLKGLTKLSRKSWQIRCLRYSELVPAEMFDMDPNKLSFKKVLKWWIKENIPNDGDDVFRGKISQNEEKDWLNEELKTFATNQLKEKEDRDMQRSLEDL